MKSLSEKLVLKDTVAIGIFFALYNIILFVVGLPVFIAPVLFLIYYPVLALVSGIPIMLFTAKVPKPKAVFILTALPGIETTLMGHHIFVALHSLAVAFIAELVFRSGRYKSARINCIVHAFFSLTMLGTIMQIWLLRDSYYRMVVNMAGEAYTQQLFKITPVWLIPLLYGATFLCGIAGGLLGKKILKKHFEKAGLV